MKRSILTLLCLALAASLFSGVTFAGDDLPHYSDIKYPPLNPVQVPKVEQFTMKNGLTVFMLEDHELPVVQGVALFQAGSIHDPKGMVGLASLTGQVMRSGGIKGKTGDQLDERLEAIAAMVESGIDTNDGTVMFRSLKENTDEVMGIFAQVLTNPQFAEEKIDLAKVGLRTAIASRNDNPGDIVRREFRKVMYGADHPRAAHSEYADLQAISRDDLVDFHSAYVTPGNTYLAIWGDFNPKAMKKMLAKHLGSWQGAKPTMPEVKDPTGLGVGGVHYIEKTDLNQANIRLGHLGIDEKHPDFFALSVLSEVLGSGFGSRLMAEVRTRQGLAYSVYGVFLSPASNRGLFLAGCETKLETTHQAISSILGELEKMRTELVTQEELDRAKNSLLNAWVFNFESRGDIVTRAMRYTIDGFPQDYLETYKQKIADITAKDILSAAKNHLHPDKVSIVVVGDESRFEKPLSEFGKVKRVDVTIPEPPKAELVMSAESAEQGKALLAKALEAHGGADAWNAVKTMKGEGSMTMMGMAMGVKVEAILPDKSVQIIAAPGMEVKVIQNGPQVAQLTPMGNQIQTLSDEEYAGANLAEASWLLMHYNDEGMTVTMDGEAVVVENSFGKRVSLTFGEDGRIGTMKHSEQGQEMTTTMSDYRQVGEVWMAFSKVTEGAGQVMESKMTALEVNPEVDPAIFEIPAQ